MLRVGLTGGIGAGKSTVARRLTELGAVLVDSDAIAREVVAPGSDGLAAVVAEFGDGVLADDGSLDRPALAAVAFAADESRARLNAVLHPRIGARTAELVAAAPPDAVVVQDVPLLVENGMAPYFALVVVVHVDAAERLRRLVELRGMSADDARARIRAQAGDEQRRAAADVWLDNSGAPGALDAVIDRLWHDRLVPFEAGLRTAAPAPLPAELVAADPTWAAQARRLAARMQGVGAARVTRVEHVGPTSVDGLAARDVLEFVAVVGSADDVATAPGELAAAGLVRGDELLVNADPGRPATVAVQVAEDPALERALLWRDWLRAEPASREDGAGAADWEPVARDWASRTGWVLPV